MIKIIEEPNVIDDHLLDIIGGEFHFNHEKGLAEWIKNSADAYIREGVSDQKQIVIIRLTDSKKPASIECIDFVGMTSDEIQIAFKRWGDPEAAKRGLKKKVYGGHGNGGKFYMRQMFKESYFITYKNGHLSLYGFSPNRKYGFAKGMQNVKTSPIEALKIASIENAIPDEIKEKILKGKTGFTLVKGVEPSNMKNVIKINHIVKALTYHPQARRILLRIPVSVIYNDKNSITKLEPPRIKPKAGFEDTFDIKIPELLTYQKDGETISVSMTNAKYKDSGRLLLKTSELALLKGSSTGDLNRIDILGELGVIGSYQVFNLNIKNPVQSVFIYGECFCPILEDPDASSVRNDREKLIENDRSEALLHWIGSKIDELTEKIAKKEAKEQEETQKKLSSKYNDFLNKWKNKFMSRLFAEILTGDRSNQQRNGDNLPGFPSDRKDKHEPKNKKGGEGNKNKAKDKKFPEVKLSSHDKDPFNPSETIHLDPRQPLIYQRPQDVNEGIFWINTSSPIAKSIIDRYGAESLRWRDFLFQRYVDIFIKESLDLLARRDPENFNLVGVDSTIDEVISRIHTEASKDLQNFLFDEYYVPS